MLKKNKIAVFICLLFFAAYSTLSVIRHNHFGSYGFDLGISDQIVWKYSQFKAPITTIQQHVFTSIFTDHIEFIYIILSPFYWVFNNPITLLLLQTCVVSFSGLAIYLLARKKQINTFLCGAILINYLMFYGIQNALWFDVHSLAFAAGFLAWFIYFLETKNNLATILFFFLAIFCKEDIALFTGIISFIYFINRRRKIELSLLLISIIYLCAIFFVYFPHFTQDGYRFQSKGGFYTQAKLSYVYDTQEKRDVMFYSIAWFGFLPLLVPLYLLVSFADIFHYFVLGHAVTTAQDMFLHYRITLAPFLVFPTIMAISKYKVLNNRLVGVCLIGLALFFQYYFHLPLSYVTKDWFWKQPASVVTINKIIQELPKDASLVVQNNIVPHVSHRDLIFTLYPTTKDFTNNSPCGVKNCQWFQWAGKPQYLLVDISQDWDERGFFINKESFIKGLENLKKAKVISLYKQQSTTYLYKIN